MTEETWQEKWDREAAPWREFLRLSDFKNNPWANTSRDRYAKPGEKHPEDLRIQFLQDICPDLDADLALSLAQTIDSANYHGHSRNASDIFDLIPRICPCLKKVTQKGK